MNRRVLLQKSFWLPIILIAVPVILRSSHAAAGVVDGLRLCGASVIPALLPYFVATSLLLLSGFQPPTLLRRLFRRVFGMQEVGTSCFLFGLLGGYPLGAKTISSLYESKQLSCSEANKLLLFCNNTGPAFFLGVVGGKLFGSWVYGAALYAIHIISAVFTGLVLCPPQKKQYSNYVIRKQAAKCPFSAAFPQAVVSSCTSMLHISAFVIFFSALRRALQSFAFVEPMLTFLSKQLHLSEDGIRAILAGFLEMTSGVFALEQAAPSVISFCLLSWIISWGGLCVHFQALSQLSFSADVGKYYLAKLLQSLFSLVLAIPIGMLLLGNRSSPIHLQISFLPFIFTIFILFALRFLKKTAKGSRNFKRNLV